ncbi:hypothetical protein CRUP_021773, partial [Coryphaenoides rupestris]
MAFEELVVPSERTGLQELAEGGPVVLPGPGGRVSSLCPLCSEWSKVILRHHRQPDATSVNWENCSPERWSQDHWELAKAYMPRGLYKVRAFDPVVTPPLCLNLLNFCKWFSAAEPRVVREVIRYRNDLMHSFDMHMDNGWMGRLPPCTNTSRAPPEPPNAECLQRLRGFLQANTDLATRFSAELQAIDPLEAAAP